MKFNDIYGVVIPETSAEDADLHPPTAVPPPRNVTAVCVNDNGLTVNDSLVYSIIEGNLSIFSIEEDTGLFTVADDAEFDFEEQQWHIVTIHCQLSSNTTVFGVGIVNVSIGPVNEYHPSLETRVVPVPETTPRGTIIAATSTNIGALGTYTVNDRDKGEDGVVTFFFEVDNADDRFFDINQKTGTITLNTDLDVDHLQSGTLQLFILIVACNDGLNPDTCLTRQLAVYITPDNDIAPVFSANLYTATLNESDTNGTLVVQAECSDGDVIFGGIETISFEEGSSNETLSTFELEYDPLTLSADVTVKTSLDYETTSTHTFTLACSDGLHTATTTVTVDVLPVNDNSPEFEQEKYEFSVNRGDPVPSDTIIGTVRATDADTDTGGTVRYSLEQGSRFTIDPESGEISLKSYLSAGDGSTFDFIVVASDEGNEARASVRVTANGLLSVLEWVYVGIGGSVILVILVIIGVVVFHHFIKAASTKTIVKEKYKE